MESQGLASLYKRRFDIWTDVSDTRRCPFSRRPLTVAMNPVVSLCSDDAPRTLPKTRSMLLTLFPGPVSAKSAQFSSHCCQLRFFPSPWQQNTHAFSSLFRDLVISRKAEDGLAGNDRCCVWPPRTNFPYWLFSFSTSWYLHLGPVISLFRECLFEWDTWHPNILLFWVQTESKCLTVSPLIIEMERLKNFTCLFFLL